MNYLYFPTKWQQVIFRNYGTVKTKLLAKILSTDEKTVEYNAKLMGLNRLSYNPDWTKKGFVTVIRNNWYILSNEDICVLLEMNLTDFNNLLKEYDFLDVKLGEKPKIESIKYYPLSVGEIKETEKIKKLVESNFVQETTKPFDFYKDYFTPKVFAEKETPNFTASYSARYSGALLDDELSDYDEEYLKRLKSTGTNGIWLSDTLRNLANFPFDESLSPDYKIRIKNLKKLTERCAKYGVGVYLYINEPRSLPKEFFDKYPNLKGQKSNSGDYCLCTSMPEVQKYLYEAVKSIAESVPKLKSIMTITMSENSTHCYSNWWKGLEQNQTECPHCKNRNPEEVCAEVCNIYAKALKDGNGYTTLIANLWGWSPFMGWPIEMACHGIELLDKDIEVLCVSEYDKQFERGGVENKVIDYSISVIGPSDITKTLLTKAKQTGHKIWAKVQMNNSWECSGVPYMPCFGLMQEHIDNVKNLGVSGIMLGWSLGGYTGGVLPLINSDKENADKWYSETYGENAEIIKKACTAFDEAFREYPFSVEGLYCGGQTLACGNLWSLKKDERISTMVCFTFDDEAWAVPYGLEIYISQYKKLTDKWEIGLKLLENVKGNLAVEEYKRVAVASYVQLKSAYNLALFTKYKKNVAENKAEILSVVNSEEELTKRLYELISCDAKIGFEMTNHYYYNVNLLLEKLINLSYIKNELQ